MTEQTIKPDEQMDKIKDLFGGDYVPEVQEDSSVDFDKPITGRYVCRVVSLKRYQGESEKCEGGIYDMYSLQLQVQDSVEGDEANNRYLSKTYSNTVGKFQDDANIGRQRLMNDLFTAGVTYDVVREVDSTADSIIEELAPQIVDQTMNVKAWARKLKDGRQSQSVKIVKEFKLKDTETKTEDGW